MLELRQVQRLDAAIAIPGSKSLSHRGLIAAALARGESRLDNVLHCEDTHLTAAALRQLGAGIDDHGRHLLVVGTGGRLGAPGTRKEIFLGNSGTSFRLLLSLFCLATGSYRLYGTERMAARPVGDLIVALERLGARITCEGRPGFPPLLVSGRPLHGGRVEISGRTSSQFVSSLLLVGPCLPAGIEIEVSTNLVSAPYVDLTLQVMQAFGVEVRSENHRWFAVHPGSGYRATTFVVEGDVSSASYFWAAAAVTGGQVVTTGIYPRQTLQGDIGLLEVLESMGVAVERGEDRVTIQGGSLRGIDVDMSQMPDMVPTLAAVALFASGTTTIRNVGHLHHKESDRLAAVASEFTKLGAKVEELAGGLVIHGGRKLAGAEVDPHGDHRLAMALAVVGLRVPGLRLRHPECVSKSFPTFWDLWGAL